MEDRETVLNELDFCLNVGNCTECEYSKGRMLATCRHIAEDTYKLLKEQEAVEPEVEVLNEIDRIYRCPKCNKAFFYKKQKFCDECGQAVKWNA